jgi:hypothetical protein
MRCLVTYYEVLCRRSILLREQNATLHLSFSLRDTQPFFRITFSPSPIKLRTSPLPRSIGPLRYPLTIGLERVCMAGELAALRNEPELPGPSHIPVLKGTITHAVRLITIGRTVMPCFGIQDVQACLNCAVTSEAGCVGLPAVRHLRDFLSTQAIVCLYMRGLFASTPFFILFRYFFGGGRNRDRPDCLRSTVLRRMPFQTKYRTCRQRGVTRRYC